MSELQNIYTSSSYSTAYGSIVCIVPTSIIIIIARIICIDKCDAMRLFCLMDIRCYIAAPWWTSLSRLIRVDCHDMFDASSYYWCPRWVEVYEAHRFHVSGSFNEDKAYDCGILDLLLLINISANQLIMIIISDAGTAHLAPSGRCTPRPWALACPTAAPWSTWRWRRTWRRSCTS